MLYAGTLAAGLYYINATTVASANVGNPGAQSSSAEYTLQIGLGSSAASVVPLPAAALLMISGLGGLGVFARKKRTA
jgi:hypothetical protein